jgi:hypothetical protein
MRADLALPVLAISFVRIVAAVVVVVAAPAVGDALVVATTKL